MANDALTKYDDLESKLNKDIKEISERIKEEFEKIIEEVEQRKDALLNILEEMKDEKINELANIREETAKSLGKAKGILEESKKTEKESELYRIVNVMLEAEKIVKEIGSVRKKLDSMDGLCFAPKFTATSDKLIAEIREFGNMKIDKEFEEGPSN